MTTAEVENLSHADLKARKDELATALEKVPAAELAARYVQARTDAKFRDEKLAEQGQTLAALQEGMTAVKAQAAQTIDSVKQAGQAALAEAERAHAAELAKVNAENAILVTLAAKRREALAGVMQYVTPLLIEG